MRLSMNIGTILGLGTDAGLTVIPSGVILTVVVNIIIWVCI